MYEDKLSEYTRLRGEPYARGEMSAEEKRVDELVRKFLNRLKPAGLQRWVAYRDESEFKRVRLRDMLWHVFEEELQHRGELNALFWLMDIDPPITGWDPWVEGREVISETAYRRLRGSRRTC